MNKIVEENRWYLNLVPTIKMQMKSTHSLGTMYYIIISLKEKSGLSEKVVFVKNEFGSLLSYKVVS